MFPILWKALWWISELKIVGSVHDAGMVFAAGVKAWQLESPSSLVTHTLMNVLHHGHVALARWEKLGRQYRAACYESLTIGRPSVILAPDWKM